MRLALLAVCAAFLATAARAAQDWQLDVRALDESGRPIAAADVRISTAGGVVTCFVAAEGYYDAVHTFHASDFPDKSATTVDITLVARRPERRLLLFAGDAMLARRYFEPRDGEPVLVRRGRELEDGVRLLEAIRPYIELADYASVNVETQLSSRDLDDRLPKSVTFYSPPELAELLRDAGFDYAALGNNHTWDYQGAGLEDTLAALDAAGLDHSGAGFDEAQAREPAMVAVGGAPHAFLSYVGWAGAFSPSQVAADSKGGAALGGTRQFREDLSSLPDGIASVLQYHAGIEYAAVPAASERLRLRQAVDYGADIAIGHHAHVLQGFEIHRNRLIAYSIGNFLFDQYIFATQMGVLVYVWLDGDELHRAEAVPLNINGYAPTPATGRFRYAVLNRLARLSRPFGTCLRDSGAHALIERCVASPAAQVVDIGGGDPPRNPLHLSRMGLAATRPVAFRAAGHQYRVGVDILRRGDFEASGLHGTLDRSWIRGPHVAVVDRESREMQISLPAGARVRTGMNAFDRVFSVSAPATLRGRVRSDVPVNVDWILQRRRTDESFAEALGHGPEQTVGRVRAGEGTWQEFAIDFDQPRLATRGVRLLIEAHNPGAAAATVQLDDLAWVEWRTPWLDGNGNAAQAAFGSHVQFAPNP